MARVVKEIEGKIDNELLKVRKYINRMNVVDENRRKRVINDIIKDKTIKPSEVLESIVKADTNAFKLIPNDQITDSMLNDMLKTYGVLNARLDEKKEETTFAFYGSLSNEQKYNDKITEPLLNKYPDIFKESFFVKTENNIHMNNNDFLKDPEYFRTIPSHFKNEEVCLFAIENTTEPLSIFQQIPEGQKSNDKCIKALINSKQVEWDDAKQRQIFVNQVVGNATALKDDNIELMINNNPLLIFNRKSKNSVETIFSKKGFFESKRNYVAKNFKFIDQAFKAAVNKGLIADFVGSLPAQSVSEDNMIGFIDYCASIDMNVETGNIAVPNGSKNAVLTFVGAMDMAHMSNKYLARVIDASVDFAPDVLDVIYNAAPAKVENSLDDEILFRAVNKDVTFIKYFKKPLSSRHKQTVLASGLAMLNNRENTLDEEKREQVTNILEHILGIAKHDDIELRMGGEENHNSLKLATILGSQKLNQREALESIQLVQQLKPELLVELLNSKEFTERRFLGMRNFIAERMLKSNIQQAIRTSLKNTSKVKVEQSIKGQYKIINEAQNDIAKEIRKNQEKIAEAEQAIIVAKYKTAKAKAEKADKELNALAKKETAAQKVVDKKADELEDLEARYLWMRHEGNTYPKDEDVNLEELDKLKNRVNGKEHAKLKEDLMQLVADRAKVIMEFDGKGKIDLDIAIENEELQYILTKAEGQQLLGELVDDVLNEKEDATISAKQKELKDATNKKNELSEAIVRKDSDVIAAKKELANATDELAANNISTKKADASKNDDITQLQKDIEDAKKSEKEQQKKLQENITKKKVIERNTGMHDETEGKSV